MLDRSLKSNMGHCEGASGLAGLVKVALATSEHRMPGNLHFRNTCHDPIVAGRLRVVTPTEDFSGGVVAVSNFGFGGTNAALLAEGTAAPPEADTSDTRFVFGRTKEAVEVYVSSGRLSAAYWRKMLPSSNDWRRFPFRGLVRKGEEGHEVDVQEVPQRPAMAWSFTGQGSQWRGMAADLWAEDRVFRTTVIDACVGLPFDPEDLFVNGDRWLDKAWSGLGITLVQLGLVAMLREQGLEPDFIFGHSVGEVACGFADGCTTAREAAAIAYVRCRLSDKITAFGEMIAVGLSLEEATKLIAQYPETVIACHNSPDGVTLSGPACDIRSLKEQLETAGRFVRLVPTDGIAYHSIFFRRNRREIREVIAEAVMENGNFRPQRSRRWLSTSGQDSHPLADAEYHANNIANMVSYCPVVSALPVGTIVVEIGPRSLLRSVIQRCNSELRVLSCMVQDERGIPTMRRLVDQLWLSGVEFRFPRFHDPLPLKHRVNIIWEHSVRWRVADYKDFEGSPKSLVTYDLAGKDAFLMDHIIDGRPLFPAAGHLYSAWKALGSGSFCFSDVRILKALIMEGESISFTVDVEQDGWRIYHDDEIVCVGRLEKEGRFIRQPLSNDTFNGDLVDGETIYRNFRRWGYDYGNSFRVIASRSLDDSRSLFNKVEHWIPYLDGILQAGMVDPRGIRLPTEIAFVNVRCSSVDDAGQIVWHQKTLGITESENVMIKGLRTSLSRKNHKQPILRAVDFVAYGEHRYEYEESYKTHVLYRLNHFVQRLWARQNDFKEYDFLPKVYQLSEVVKYDIEDHQNDFRFPLLRIISSLETIEPRELLDNAYLAISMTDGHDDLYFSDPSASCIGAYHGLQLFAQILRENIPESYSVLEVGGGSGGLTRHLFPLIEADISSYISSDVSVVRQHFESVKTLRYDLNDPWCGDSVDVIAASNAVHTCKNIRATLGHLFSALNDGGFLIIHEYISVLPALLWGLSSFAFSSEDCRDFALWIDKRHWLALLQDSGFEPIVWFVDAGDSQLLLLARKITHTPIPEVVHGREKLYANFRQIVETSDYGYLGMVRALRREPGFADIWLRLSIDECDPSPWPDSVLPFLLRKKGRIGGVFESGFQSSVSGIRASKMVVRVPGDLSTMSWVERVEAPNCEIQCCGLNFKDAMLAYGKLDHEGEINLGLEFSGQQGQRRVMGISPGSMATHTHCPEYMMWTIPEELSFEEAATIPVVYATAYFALIVKANIAEGQTVLIHSVAGGVGQAALRICLSRGVRVIGSCSKAKTEWVVEHLGLSPEYIVDSHNASFKRRVLEITEGKGVDVNP